MILICRFGGGSVEMISSTNNDNLISSFLILISLVSFLVILYRLKCSIQLSRNCGRGHLSLVFSFNENTSRGFPFLDDNQTWIYQIQDVFLHSKFTKNLYNLH